MGNVCDKYCENCIYFHGWSDNGLCCNYILMKGVSRPCDPGKGCTVKIKRKRKRRVQADRRKENER